MYEVILLILKRDMVTMIKNIDFSLICHHTGGFRYLLSRYFGIEHILSRGNYIKNGVGVSCIPLKITFSCLNYKQLSACKYLMAALGPRAKA